MKTDIRCVSSDDSIGEGFLKDLETDFNGGAFRAAEKTSHDSTSLQNQLRPSSLAVDARVGRLPPLPWRSRQPSPVDKDVEVSGGGSSSSDNDEDASSELSEPPLLELGTPPPPPPPPPLFEAVNQVPSSTTKRVGGPIYFHHR